MKVLVCIFSLLAAANILAAQAIMSNTSNQVPFIDPDHSRKLDQDMSIRTEFGEVSCLLRSYPSIGGIVLGVFTGAELDWLGLSRSEPSSRSLDPQAEDEFSFQMLRLGARWWRSEAFYDKRLRQVNGGYSWPESFPPDLHVGYPSTGGIWVLKVLSGDSSRDDFARIIMAFTMDERCTVLKEMGATFYPNVDDCHDIAKSLEDGVAIGKRWEERMEKDMDE